MHTYARKTCIASQFMFSWRSVGSYITQTLHDSRLFNILCFIHQVSINFYKLTNKTKLVIELIKQDQTEQHLIRPAVCQTASV